MSGKFSPSEAAISIIQFAKVQPKFCLKYSLFYGVVNIISVFLLAASGYFGIMKQLSAIDPNDASAEWLNSLFSSVNWSIVLVMIAFSVAVSVIFICMGLRKTVRNEEVGFYGITWGKDENNLFAGAFILGLIYIGIVFVFSFLAAFLGKLLGPIAETLIFALMFASLIWYIISISQFGVLTVAHHKFELKATLNETKEHFWSYLGAYFLAFVLTMITLMILQGIFGAILNMNNNVAFPETVAQVLDIRILLYYFISGFIAGFMQLAFICVGAYAFHKRREVAEDEIL